MNWKKLGQLYPAKSIHPKLVSHAANPLPVFLEGDIYRVFFSGRDEQNRSSVGCVDIDMMRQEIVRIHNEPVFEHGPEGSFYSHGVSIGNCYEADGKRYMLFMGWQCPPGEHWHGEIGRLTISPDWSLSMDDERPFMTLEQIDQVSLSYPWVMQDDDQNYRMWYGSTLSWDTGHGEMLHVLNYATSRDGSQWIRHGLAIPYELGKAQAFSRPTVVGNACDGYHMWFSYRSGIGEKYGIGYAYSPDAVNWAPRLESAGINASPTGWDSEMIEYPFVFDHKGQRYMLYNGTGYGKTGFGLAVLTGG